MRTANASAEFHFIGVDPPKSATWESSKRLWPAARTVRLDRDLRNHVGFGMGIHYCLGAPLARAEAKITLNAFLDRYAEIKRAPSLAVRQISSPVVFGFQHLPLALGRSS